jgi:hypothetical protein
MYASGCIDAAARRIATLRCEASGAIVRYTA